MAGLKKISKKSILEVFISRVAIAKVGYQMDYYEDPIIRSQLDDKQSALAQIRANVQKLEDSDDQDEREAQAQILQNEIAALQKDIDVIKSQGLVLDPLLIDDFRIDSNIDSLYQNMDDRRRDPGEVRHYRGGKRPAIQAFQTLSPQ
jgi:hypothetical protein